VDIFFVLLRSQKAKQRPVHKPTHRDSYATWKEASGKDNRNEDSEQEVRMSLQSRSKFDWNKRCYDHKSSYLQTCGEEF
jgi:hypothetical protein